MVTGEMVVRETGRYGNGSTFWMIVCKSTPLTNAHYQEEQGGIVLRLSPLSSSSLLFLRLSANPFRTWIYCPFLRRFANAFSHPNSHAGLQFTTQSPLWCEMERLNERMKGFDVSVYIERV